jgi:hypothetical protein
MGEENSRQLGRRADSALPSDWSKNGIPVYLGLAWQMPKDLPILPNTAVFS